MKITKKSSIHNLKFKEVTLGQVFEWNMNCYMKIEEVLHPEEDLKFNSVCISDGCVCHFSDTSLVILLDAELILRG